MGHAFAASAESPGELDLVRRENVVVLAEPPICRILHSILTVQAVLEVR
jgi:hypothetical protein